MSGENREGFMFDEIGHDDAKLRWHGEKTLRPVVLPKLLLLSTFLFSPLIALGADFTSCDADLNEDGRVNFLDLATMSTQFFWDCTQGTCDADINDDLDVNFADLAIVKNHFFEDCVPEPCPPCKSYLDGVGTYGEPDFIPGTCPKVTLADGTVCNEAITSVIIHFLDEE
jgi:hypothetical protein